MTFESGKVKQNSIEQIGRHLITDGFDGLRCQGIYDSPDFFQFYANVFREATDIVINCHTLRGRGFHFVTTFRGLYGDFYAVPVRVQDTAFIVSVSSVSGLAEECVPFTFQQIREAIDLFPAAD